MDGRRYEPDEHFTQRITAVHTLGAKGPFLQMSILRRSDFGDSCNHSTYYFDQFGPGFGFCITTYAGDGTPLLPFRGEPFLMPLRGQSLDVAQEYWEALNEENKVSLAVKFIDRANGRSSLFICNKYEQAA